MAWAKVGLAVVFLSGVLYQYKNTPQKSIITQVLNKEYDYIVVGAGAAGSIIASRLSEDAEHSVLLLEAGDDDSQNLDAIVPYRAPSLLKSVYDWEYYSTPQKKGCKKQIGKSIYWPRGKILGGSSAINWMVFIRGSPHDFDYWANDLGCEGWSYKDILPYYLKSEGNTDKERVKSGYHNDSGPLGITSLLTFPEATKLFQDGFKELGLKERDIDGAIQEDTVDVVQLSVKNGVRSSTSHSYLRPAMKRKNLHVATLAHVTKVIIQNKKAIGVEFVRNGVKQEVFCRKEVVLSAGTIGSPQLLMLSGIGHKKHLKEMKIPLVADLPVGDNLHDHLQTTDVQYIVDKPIALLEKDISSLKTQLQYQLFGTGPLASGILLANVAMMSKHQPANRKAAFIQMIPTASLPGNGPGIHQGMRTFVNAERDDFDFLNKDLVNKHGFQLNPQVSHPVSRGTIRLKSSDPFQYPAIDPNILAEEQDINILIEGIERVTKLEETKAFKDIGVKLIKRQRPSCRQHPWGTHEYWKCVVDSASITAMHPVGTCKMGPKEDPTTVVDPQLRVKGIQGLRVADASIMPEITTGNTYAPCIMIGEKASDIIRGKVTVNPAKVLQGK